MKSPVKIFALAALVALAARANAAVNVNVDPGQNWLGYMNVFELPANGHERKFGSAWGPADLPATFSGPVLTLAPNSINDPSPYWYTPSGGPGAQGNKEMDANFYVEDSNTLPGQQVNFSGEVLSNTLVAPYTSVAFIKDFVPDYSSVNSVTAPLAPGEFHLSLQTVAGHHIQYGFETIGPDVWITDAASKGFVQVRSLAAAPIPEPSTLALAASSLIGLLRFRRRSTD